MLLIGFGGNAEDDIADLELVGPEQGGGGGPDQSAGDLQDIRLGRAPSPGLADAVAALRVVETIYQKSGYA